MDLESIDSTSTPIYIPIPTNQNKSQLTFSHSWSKSQALQIEINRYKTYANGNQIHRKKIYISNAKFKTVITSSNPNQVSQKLRAYIG